MHSVALGIVYQVILKSESTPREDIQWLVQTICGNYPAGEIDSRQENWPLLMVIDKLCLMEEPRHFAMRFTYTQVLSSVMRYACKED